MKIITLTIKSFIITAIILQSIFVFAQEPDPIKTGKELFMAGNKTGLNIEVGVGYHSFLIMEGKASFIDKISLSANTFEYYAGTSGIHVSDLGYNMYTGIRIGKREHTSTPEYADSISMFNFSSMEYYFIGAKALISKMYDLGYHMYWSWSPGVYVDYILGNMEDEIKNGKLSMDMTTISWAQEPQDIRPADFGVVLNFEFGLRAAYLGLSFRAGLLNLAPKGADMTIRNTGMANFYVGYRFESDIAKEDQRRINSIIPN